jgi:uncharacterized membrane protein HdeD (DUF308 family)
VKPHSWIALILGIVFVLFGIIALAGSRNFSGIIPLLIGGSLCYLGWSGGRIAMLVFGHTCIVLGCLLITLGIYLLPYSKPTLSHVFTRPLFWGLFSLFGGICANYHGFCKCIRVKSN